MWNKTESCTVGLKVVEGLGLFEICSGKRLGPCGGPLSEMMVEGDNNQSEVEEKDSSLMVVGYLVTSGRGTDKRLILGRRN